MKLLRALLHTILREAGRWEHARFRAALTDPERAQRNRLCEILADFAPSVRDYETFAAQFPVTEYVDWRESIERARAENPTGIRYEPTSGSTGERKWIPYPRAFLRETNRAARVWLFDLYRRYPGIARGPHFWSLSWIPTELRGTVETNDAELFPFWQRILLGQVLVAHPALARATTAEASWWATKLAIAAEPDLSFLSAWSPSYASALLREIFADRGEIARALSYGTWGRHTAELERFPRIRIRHHFPADAEITATEFVHRAWPSLALVSAWDAAASAPFAEALKEMIPGIAFQGKGLWATEGVVTFPYAGTTPLALRSHFYEFRRFRDDSILPSWKLALGDEVQPILTTGSGLIRYALSDRLRVTGFLDRTATLEFLGRLGGVDLVGEKIGFEKAEALLAELASEFPRVSFVCLGAGREDTQARYWALGIGEPGDAESIATFLEARLREVHHYSTARDLHQLRPAGARIVARREEIEPFLGKNPIRGQNKPCPIVIL